MSAITVLVIDFHPGFLAMVVRFLEQRTAQGFVVVGAACCPADAEALARHHQPQVIISGLNSDTRRMLGLLPALRAASSHVKIIVIAQLTIVEYRQAAFAAGADHFLGKDVLHSELIPAIKHVVGNAPSGNQMQRDNER